MAMIQAIVDINTVRTERNRSAVFLSFDSAQDEQEAWVLALSCNSMGLGLGLVLGLALIARQLNLDYKVSFLISL